MRLRESDSLTIVTADEARLIGATVAAHLKLPKWGKDPVRVSISTPEETLLGVIDLVAVSAHITPQEVTFILEEYGVI